MAEKKLQFNSSSAVALPDVFSYDKNDNTCWWQTGKEHCSVYCLTEILSTVSSN
jgi:hypothetical protein